MPDSTADGCQGSLGSEEELATSTATVWYSLHYYLPSFKQSRAKPCSLFPCPAASAVQHSPVYQVQSTTPMVSLLLLLLSFRPMADRNSVALAALAVPTSMARVSSPDCSSGGKL